MKKILQCTAFALCLLMLGGCGMMEQVAHGTPHGNAVVSRETTLPAKTPATIENLMPSLELVNSSFLEIYGAEVDWDKAFYFVYSSEEAAMNEEAPVAISDDESVNDPAYQQLYRVMNFNTVEQWRAYLINYLSEELADQWIENGRYDLAEYFGTMYIVQGARGYGAYMLDLDTARIVASDENNCTVEVDCTFFDEFDSVYSIRFENRQNRWIVVATETKQ